MRLAAIGLLVLYALLFLAPSQTKGVTFYNPCSIVSLTSNAADAPSEITTTFGVGLQPGCTPFSSAKDNPPEWIHHRLVSFTPRDWQVATDADIPDGVEVGEFNSRNVLGLFDTGCNQVLPLNFVLLDGTVDVTKPIDALPPGSADRLKPLSDKNAEGVPGGAEYWPSYLTDLADRSGMDLSKLVARSFGINSGGFPSDTTVLNLLTFEPGATVFDGVNIDPGLGFPTISILNDPTIPASANGAVSDFCAPFWSDYTLFDSVNGIPYRQNPGDGVYNFVAYSAPAPDADNDGIENGLDPCPYLPNLSGWDPRGILIKDQTPGDNDVDGLPDECDPDPLLRSDCAADNGASGHDQDCDGWANRMDNCPLIANGEAQLNLPGVGNQTDTDGDDIGDACDHDLAGENTVDGQNLPVCTLTRVTIGAGGLQPPNPQFMSPCSTFLPCGHPTDAQPAGACPVPFSSDVDCNDTTDLIDVLAELQSLASLGSPACIADAYTGCDEVLDAGDIAGLLKHLAEPAFDPRFGHYCNIP